MVDRKAPVDDDRDLTWELRVYSVPGQVTVEVWREEEVYAMMTRGTEGDQFFRMNLPDRVMDAATRIFGV